MLLFVNIDNKYSVSLTATSRNGDNPKRQRQWSQRRQPLAKTVTGIGHFKRIQKGMLCLGFSFRVLVRVMVIIWVIG